MSKTNKEQMKPEVIKLMKLLATQPIETIETFYGKINKFNRKEYILAVKNRKQNNKTVDELLEYVFFIANKNKKDNFYMMSPSDMVKHITDYFTDNVVKEWNDHLKKLKDDAIKAEKAKAQKKLDDAFIASFDPETASDEDFLKYSKIKVGAGVIKTDKPEDIKKKVNKYISDNIKKIQKATKAKLKKAAKKVNV